MRKAALRIFLLLSILGASYLVAGAASDASAASRGGAICGAIKAGQSRQQLRETVARRQGQLYFLSPEYALAGASGPNLLCQCRVSLQQEKVVWTSRARCSG